MPTPTVPLLGIRVYVALTLGFRVVKVDLVDVAMPSGPVAATVKVYTADGCSSSLVAQVPSGPACICTLSPLASTSDTARTVPEDARTVTAALGGTSTARSAGDTVSTAGVVPRLGVVVAEVL